MNELTRREYNALLRLDLCAFAQRCFHELNPGTAFVPGGYVELLASRLEAVRAGESKRLIVNMPPRSLKSLLGSVALPAWWLGHDPSAQIVCVSYAQDLADKLSRDCRAVMAAPWYRRPVPDPPVAPPPEPRASTPPPRTAAGWPPRWAAC